MLSTLQTSRWDAPLPKLLTCCAANINRFLLHTLTVQKVHYHHSGWIGGMKEIRYDKLMKENPEKAMMLAVKGMIPDTTIGRQALTRCRIYRSSEHNHAAQKPEQL